VAAVFYVVILRQWRDHGGAAFDLADAAQDDFRAAVVDFHGSADFDASPFEAPDVAYIFQVVGKDYDREGAGHRVFTEIKEVDAFFSHLYSNYLPYDTLCFPYVLAGFVNGNAVGGLGCAWRQQEEQERD
jgi:hypothetical protein